MIRACAFKHPDPHVTANTCSLCRLWHTHFRSSMPSDLTVVGRQTRELVIVRHTENVEWAKSLPFPVWIYNKGERLTGFPDNVIIVNRPNVGREAEGYAHHVANRYDFLPEVVFFSQANPFVHCSDYVERLGHDYTEPTSLTTQYKPDWPPNHIKALDKTETVNGFEVRYGKAQTKDVDPKLIEIWDMPAWNLVFNNPLPNPLWYGYGACWAVPKQFLQGRSRDWWEWLSKNIHPTNEVHSNTLPLTSYTLESMWGCIFRPDLYQTKAIPKPVKKPCNCGKPKLPLR